MAANHCVAVSTIYSFTGSTASKDSTINAWFQFDSSAMSDGLVFFYEIPQLSFQISGSNSSMNGDYDLFMGGGIGFATATPGPQNLPSFQSLVIQNSATHYYVQSDFAADPNVFIGGPSGIGTVYAGVWTYGVVPEPPSFLFPLLGAVFLLFLGKRNNRLTKRCSEPGHYAPVAIHTSRGPGR